MKFFKNIFNSDKRKEQPLINILTRTSNRPNGFKLCYDSIRRQTYKNVRHIVSYDTLEDLAYLEEYNIEKIKVQKKQIDEVNIKEPSGEFKPYNLYCNDLLDEVKEGWIMFLDDDDMLADDEVLENVLNNLEKKSVDSLLIWQTKFPDGALLPPLYEFKKRNIRFERIDTACFMFHSKYKDVSRWDSWYAADFRFIEGLAKFIPRQKWIPQVFTLKNNFGDQGRRNDVPTENVV